MTSAFSDATGRNWPTVMQAALLTVLFVTVVNGMPFWLKRVGLTEVGLVQEYRSVWQELPDTVRFGERRLEFARFREKLHRPRGVEWACKIVKDLYALGLFVLLIGCRGRNGAFGFRKHPLLIGLAAMAGVAGAVSVFRQQALLAVLGVRNLYFLFLTAASLGVFRKNDFELLSRSLLLLLLVQCTLMPFEAAYGMDLFQHGDIFGGRGDRCVGTLVFPLSLGSLAVLSFSFYSVFCRTGPGIVVVGTAALFLVYCSASATAWVMLVLTTLILFGGRFNMRRLSIHATMLCAVFLIGLLAVLPFVLQRPDVYDSLWGRAMVLENLLRSMEGPVAILFGQGLGVDSNAVFQLSHHLGGGLAGQPARWALSPDLQFPDSTPAAMILQFGVVGSLLFYTTLLWAGWRDMPARPVYLNFLLISLSLNILEFFPVNIILGLMLGRSLAFQTEKAPFL